VRAAVNRIERAVILAAGRGTRLAGELSDRPKGFIRIGAQPIVEESIDRLLAAGVREVLIVTGHLASWYEDLAARRAGSVRTVHHERFADSGSMYSLYCARERVPGPFLLLESDLVYEPRALGTLLAGPAEDAILLSGPTGAGDEIYVATRDGMLTGMSKRRVDLSDDIAGELVGITRVSAGLFALMCRIAEAAFRRSLMFDYETDCLVAAGRERPIACPLVPDLLWGEIDDSSHLERVRERVYPQLQQQAAGSVAEPRY
jgi:2-aminoethylphosphonate-pyruvate transaminase